MKEITTTDMDEDEQEQALEEKAEEMNAGGTGNRG